MSKLLSVDDVLALRGPQWLADFVLPKRSIGMLWGPPKIGKSFVTLDLACSIALGNSFLGRDTTPSRVVYVAAEGAHSFKNRITAWLQYNELEAGDLDNLKFIDHPLKLHEGVLPFLRQIEEFEPALVIIDTLAACTLGAGEDKTEQVGPTIESLLKIRKEARCAVLVLHHTGWTEEHERGSSALRGAMDLSIQMAADKGWDKNRNRRVRWLDCHKQRDAREFDRIYFQLQEVTWETEWKGEVREHNSLVPKRLRRTM